MRERQLGIAREYGSRQLRHRRSAPLLRPRETCYTGAASHAVTVVRTFTKAGA